MGKQQSRIVSIHILDDDSLLNIFCLYRPLFLGEDENDLNRLQGGMPWDRGRWWYRLAHVCQRWRNLILGSASYLRLSLVCTNGTPVANMLAHSPPLPLTVDYNDKDGITAEDEEGILLALEQRHRVRHLRLVFPVQNLQRLVTAIDEEFPTLEYLIINPPLEDNTDVKLPETLQAPHLRHLTLRGFACPIRSRLHPTAGVLATLCLTTIHPSAYFQPNVLLQSISCMPQLESLEIAFQFPVRNRDVERQLTHLPITTQITLPNLRLFWFRGVSAYLEEVVCRITTPRLENLRIRLFEQLTFSVPHLRQFMDTTENFTFDKAEIMFKDKETYVLMSSREADTYAFGVTVDCWHLDWQVSSVAQITNALSQVFSTVECLTLRHEVHSQSSEEHNDVDRIEWRNLFRSFSNVKTLRVGDRLVRKLSRCLLLEDGELPLELLPELQELTYSGSRVTGGAFTSFIDTRQSAGRPVRLVRDRARFSCDDCGAEYVQRQGLNRHYRKRHQPSLCMYCDAEWGRPYEYRDHLEKHHPDVDPDMVLGKAGSSRGSAIFARHRSQQVSLPTIEYGDGGHSGIGLYPPAVVNPSTITLYLPDMTYVPQPESTQPIMTSKNIPEGEHVEAQLVNIDKITLDDGVQSIYLTLSVDNTIT